MKSKQAKTTNSTEFYINNYKENEENKSTKCKNNTKNKKVEDDAYVTDWWSNNPDYWLRLR